MHRGIDPDNTFWLVSQDVGRWIMWWGISPPKISSKENSQMKFSGSSSISSTFSSTFVALPYFHCVLVVGYQDNQIRYSHDFGETWNVCNDDYLGQSPRAVGGGSFGNLRLHSCFVFDTRLYSIRNKGAWKTK
jgi:hypothetical protein